MGDSLNRLVLHILIGVLAVVVVMNLASGDKGQFDSIEKLVDGGAFKLLNYATVVAAVGAVAMALVELVKAMGDVRRWYHEWKLRQWLDDRRALEDLLYLSIGDRARTDALCGQPLEKMMGQVQAAANAALDFPAEYPDLFRFLTTTDLRPPSEAGSPFAEGIPGVGKDRAADDRSRWEFFARTREQARPAGPVASVDAAKRAPDPEEQAASRARMRLANLVARKLDGFQLRTQYYWDRGNQLASVVVSIGIMFYALSLTGMQTGSGIPLHGIWLGLFSGALAPFAKDLTRGLSQFART